MNNKYDKNADPDDFMVILSDQGICHQHRHKHRIIGRTVIGYQKNTESDCRYLIAIIECNIVYETILL